MIACRYRNQKTKRYVNERKKSNFLHKKGAKKKWNIQGTGSKTVAVSSLKGLEIEKFGKMIKKQVPVT